MEGNFSEGFELGWDLGIGLCWESGPAWLEGLKKLGFSEGEKCGVAPWGVGDWRRVVRRRLFEEVEEHGMSQHLPVDLIVTWEC